MILLLQARARPSFSQVGVSRRCTKVTQLVIYRQNLTQMGAVEVNLAWNLRVTKIFIAIENKTLIRN
jgi:hypothetical protein